MCRSCEQKGEMRAIFKNLPSNLELRAVAASIMKIGMCIEAEIVLDQVINESQLSRSRPSPVEQDTPGGGR